MQGSTRRRPLLRNGSVAGSVWESRMRMDAVNGGIKVFNAAADEGRDDESNAADEEGMRVYRRLRRNRSDSIAAAARKRRSWTPPSAAADTAGALIDKSPIQLRKARSELGNSSTRFSAGNSAGAQKQVLLIGDGTEPAAAAAAAAGSGDEKKMVGKEEEVEIEMEEDNKSFDDKEMDDRMEKPDDMETEEEEAEEEEEEEEDDEDEKRINQIHEIPVLPATAEKKQNPVTAPPSPMAEPKQNYTPKKELKRSHVSTPSSTDVIKMQNPVIVQVQTVEKKLNHVIDHRALDPDPAKSSAFEEAEEAFYDISANHNRMQRIVDLIMWRDVSRTAFVFGLGAFSLISSSYAKDLSFSLISVASYAGLIYLALIFVYKSILHRGDIVEYGDERYMVGEEEAIWLLRMLLPYINELLFKLRSLFSGDPATTMKLAVLLFALARCGSSITPWSLAKMMFFGLFTVPKVCSSYSAQLSRYGKFWLERFRDGWESCSHKKAVAGAVFTIIWNISSTVARIWAVFMLVVAMKLYQQCVVAEDWSGEQQQEEEEEVVVVAEQRQEDSKTGQNQGLGGRHRQRGGPTRNEVVRERKLKRGCE